MITYEWREALEEGERRAVLALVQEAAEFDAEAGFSKIDPEDVASGGKDSRAVSHLLIRAQLDLAPDAQVPAPGVLPLAAYLHLSVAGPERAGTLQLVVHPDFRSHGVATLLVEELGLDVTADGGWAGRGAGSLRMWAEGSHPAADRMSRRFSVPSVSRTWKLIRHLTGPFATEIPAVAAPAGISIELRENSQDPDLAAAVEGMSRGQDVREPDRERLIKAMGRGGGRALIARQDGAVVGFSWLDAKLQLVEGRRAGMIHAVMTAPSVAGRGLGRALLAGSLQALRDADAQLVQMWVNPEDEAAVHLSRLLDFEQDQADVCYLVSPGSGPGNA